jgi:hypothetical protein
LKLKLLDVIFVILNEDISIDLLKTVLELVNNIFLVDEPNKARPFEFPHIL